MNMSNQPTPEVITRHLSCFTGTQQYYRLFPNFLLTEGAHYVAEACQAYWLFDLIASHQHNPKIANDPLLQAIQFWTLDVEEGQGRLRCEWDLGQVVLTQEIPYTDFPLAQIQIWVQGSTGIEVGKMLQVAMLPSEY
jgi:hypothetical protein